VLPLIELLDVVRANENGIAKMVEVVFALLMIVDHEIKEHLHMDSLSKCLKGKRIAERQLKAESRVQYKCIKSKANTEIYMGEKKILSLILE
jgi:uncharacterized protein (DUF362 family)